MRRTLPSGFTLIEVVVALAVLTVLSALLFSAFARIKVATQRATCVSNLNQIGLACQMYVSDTGLYPQPHSGRAWADKVFPYVRKTQIFECPSSFRCTYVPGTEFLDTGPDKNEYNNLEMYWGSYDMTSFKKTLRPFHFRHPGTTIFILDGSGETITPSHNDLSQPDVYSTFVLKEPRHQGGSNCLFIDWHVKWTSREQLRDRALWSVDTPPPLS